MSINFIKENLKKMEQDNLITFLFDLIVRGGIDEIEDFDDSKEYTKNEKVYFKDVKGIHHIYKCKVNLSTVGVIDDTEWVDLLQSFRKPIVNENTITTNVDIREEVLFSTTENQSVFELNTPGVEESLYTIIIFHPDKGRLAQTDFDVAGNEIILHEGFFVENIGDKIIVDLYQKM